MKKVFGYIRVSTVKQGTGVSLQEQKEAIIRYAEKNNLNIIQWFEELETAAKQGRPLFTKMMKLLRSGKAAGAIIHKIDRSARNLKDWAALGDLIDEGIEVHFAHESLDMDTRGGRLAADIQAVIASDYIRNLREEAIKGLYGRLKQGIYPFGAPIGYINNGGGNVKTIDPILGPLILKAFELYATEKYNLFELAKKMHALGLRNTNNKAVSKTTLSKILNNSFYVGVMIIKGKPFNGNHEPLVPAFLFNQVRSILQGKTNTKSFKHSYIFRRIIKCGSCNYSLIAEAKKGHIYYRCHTQECPTTKTIREDRVIGPLMSIMSSIQLDKIETNTLEQLLEEVKLNWISSQTKLSDTLRMQEQKVSQKLERLTDAYIENILDKEAYNIKKGQLMIELKEYQGKNKDLTSQKESIFRKANNYLEFLKTLLSTFNSGIIDEKRKIVKIITSNLSFSENQLSVVMKSPFIELANRSLLLSGGHVRPIPRTSIFEFAIPATNGRNRYSPKEVKLEPRSIIQEVPFPINLPSPEMDAVRESMKELLLMILDFFEEEQKKVEEGAITEEETLLPYVQEDDSNTQFNTRPIPENFKRLRA